jgi:hypothetical protein
MSEYIEIETESSDDGRTMYFHTNLRLAVEGPETYASAEAMAEGSPLAQMLAVVEGITRLEITDSDMVVTRAREAPWHSIVADISAVLKEFFL